MGASLRIAGKKFGRLTAESPVNGSRTRKRKWSCKCDCGKVTAVDTYKLLSGHTRSCGCLHERGGRLPRYKNRALHSEPTWKSWASMLWRCKPKYPRADYYFNRGIRVCEEWKNFDQFLSDMGWRPKGTTLDRIDCNKNYEPGNCRWASAKTQQRNRRRTRTLLVNGELRILMDVADQLGIKKSAAQYFFSVAKILQRKFGKFEVIDNGDKLRPDS